MLLLIAAFFAVCIAYVAWCDRIIGPDPRPGCRSTSVRTSARTTLLAGRRSTCQERDGVMIAAAADNWIGLGLAVLLTIYLVVVLVRPEKF